MATTDVGAVIAAEPQTAAGREEAVDRTAETKSETAAGREEAVEIIAEKKSEFVGFARIREMWSEETDAASGPVIHSFMQHVETWLYDQVMLRTSFTKKDILKPDSTNHEIYF